MTIKNKRIHNTGRLTDSKKRSFGFFTGLALAISAAILIFSGCEVASDIVTNADIAAVNAAIEILDYTSITFEDTEDQDTVRSDFILPLSGEGGTTISWTSSNTDMLSIDQATATPGSLKTGEASIEITLTATVSKGSAKQSKPFSITILANDNETPGIPTGLSINSWAADSLELEWTDALPGRVNGEAGTITGYTVYYSTSDDFLDLEGLKSQSIVSEPLTETKVTDLNPGTQYYFAVTASNANGEGPVSPSLATHTNTPENFKPEAPAIIERSAGNGQVELTWTTPAATGWKDGQAIAIRGYNIYQDSKPITDITDTAGLTTVITDIEPEVRTRTVSELNNGEAYYFAINALSGEGVESPLNGGDISVTPGNNIITIGDVLSITDLSHTVTALTGDSAVLSIDNDGLTHTRDYTLSISPDANGNIRIDNDGTISIGAGITVSDARDYTITAAGQNGYSGTIGGTFTLTVNPRTLTSALLGSMSTTDFEIQAGFANTETRTLNFDGSLTVGTDYTLAITERPPDADSGHLSLDAATAVLTLSTDIAPGDSGVYTVTVSAAGSYTDPSTPLTAVFRLTVTKADILSITYSPVTAIFKTAMTQSASPTIEPADAAANASFTISPDLHTNTGLSFNPATGAISGTPTIRASGDYSVSIEGKDGTKYEGAELTSASFSVSIDPKPIEGTLSYDGSSIATTYGTAQALSIQWTGDLPEQTVSYAIAPKNSADPALPDDILFTTGTGALSVSNMSAVHTGTYTVTASGSVDYTGTKSVDVDIKIDPKALETADFSVQNDVTVTALTANEIPDVMTSSLTADTDYTLAITNRPNTPNAAAVSIDNDGKVSTTDVITNAADGSYTVTASGNGNYSGTVTGTFTLTVNSRTLTSAMLGSISTTDFEIQVGFTNAETRTLSFDGSLTIDDDYTLAITGRPPDAKPDHLSLDAATAVLTLSTDIVPDDSGEYTVTVSAAGNYTDPVTPLTATFMLTVTKADILSITYSPVTAIFKTAMAQSASPTIEPADAAANASFTISPNLHTNTGLSFDPATGAISGTPTIRASGDYSVRIKGKDGTKYEGAELTSASFSVSIDPKPIEGTLSYDGSSIATTYGTAQALNIQWTGDLPEQTVTYAIAPKNSADPALPDDILFTTGTGALSVSNMSAVHTGTYTVTASGSVDYTGTKSVEVNIKIEPKALSDVSGFSITGSGTVTALTGGSATATVAGGLTHTSDYTLSIAKEGSPVGAVSIDNDGTISIGSGITVNDAGAYTITATGQNNYGGQVTGTFNLTVNPIPLTSALLGSISNPQSDFTVAIGLTSDVSRTLSFSSSLTIGSDFSLAISSIPTDATAGHVSLDSNTGVLTISKDVVPADSGTYSLNATGKGNYSGTAAASFEMAVKTGISGTLSYADLEIAAGQTKRSNASWNNAASGQTVRYTLVSPPAGISIDETNGVVTVDTAVVTADTSCSIRAEGIGNYIGETTADLKVFIRDWMAPDLTLTYTDIRVYKGSSASRSPQWSNGGPTVVYDMNPLSGGTLPDEIRIDPSSGDISVSSSAALQADTVYQVTATATGSWKGWKTAEIRISVYDTFSYEFKPALVGQEFTLPAINAASFEQFDASPSLPAGLDLDPQTGEISGTPTTRQLAVEYTITATPTGGSAISNNVYLFIQEQAVDKDDLWRMIDEEILAQGNTADLGLIDTSSITDMSHLFNSATWSGNAHADYSAFNGDLSGWDVSSVTSMYSMFEEATSFNGDLSGWDVSSVTDMRYMFSYTTAFNGDLSGWDVSNVTDMRSMFSSATNFNGDISGWDVSSVTYMYSMFNGATSFNGDLSGWDISSVTNMWEMFKGATSFNGDLSGWDVSSVTSMYSMFNGATSFNGDLSGWDISSVTVMYSMFNGATAFNGDISEWDVSGLTYMWRMFAGATSFNGDLSGWDVSSVTFMSTMFKGATSFNGDLSGWDVSSVTSMSSMFEGATAFNGDLSGWDVSSVTSMYSMFNGATSFNGDLSGWDISSVTNMWEMFKGATSFNGDLSSWDVSSVTNMWEMFKGATSFNGDLSGWDVSSVTDMNSMFNGATDFNRNLEPWGAKLGSSVSMDEMFDSSGLANNPPSWYSP